VCGWVGQQHGL
jgi:hypothetical protein